MNSEWLAHSKSLVHAATIYLDKVTVCLAAPKDDGMAFASGTLIKINGRYFVMTCGHFVSAFEAEDICMSHSSSVKYQHKEVIRSFIRKWHLGGGEYDKYDLGCLEIEPNPEGIAALGMEFIEPSSIWNEGRPPEKAAYILVGFPSDFIPSEYLNKKELRFRMLSYGTSVKISDNPELDADSHFVISYNKSQIIKWGPDTEEFNSIKFPEPFGLSGGGIWKINDRVDGIWSPEKMQLVGIEYQWWSKRSEAQANYARDWFDQLFKKLVMPNI